MVYLAVRWVVCVLQAVSLERAYGFARVLAGVLYWVDRRHRLVGLSNLEAAFGDRLSSRERELVVRGVYLHFSMMLVEMVRIPRKLRIYNWRRWIEAPGAPAALDALLEGGPLMFLTGHYGNWEMAGYLFGVYGFPSESVARPLDNPYLDRFLREFREREGQRMIPKKGGYERMVEVLESGGRLALLADQDAGQNGVFVPFFGRLASTHKAIGLLAIEHRAPVLAGYARRIGPGFRYEVGIADIIRPEELDGFSDPVTELTRRYTAAVESFARLDIRQYLWLHRRWKHQPRPRVRKGKGKASAGAGAEGEASGASG